MVKKVVASTCRECFVGCGSLITLEDDKVVRISGNPDHPHSRGAFCAKGMNGPLTQLYHPKRPLRPLRRKGMRGSGEFEEISWETALQEIADKLVRVKLEHGSTALAGAVSNQYYDRGVAMSLLLRSFGSPNYMINQDMCTGCRSTAAVVTGITAEAGSEIRTAKCIMVVGRSPSESNIVEWMDIKKAKADGAKLIVVDPRRTQLAQMADIWLQVKPGTDAALALAMLRTIFDRDLIDKRFLDAYCNGTEQLRERVQRTSVEEAAETTGVPTESIEAAAEMFATEEASCLVLGHGIDAQANGVYTAMSFQALLAVTGNIDRQGSNRIYKAKSGFRDYVKIVKDPKFRMPAEREGQIIGGDTFPLWSGPLSWGAASHNPSVIDAIRTGHPYPVRAMYISGVNIVCTYPGMQNTIEALKSLDLLVVASDHITPTAELADYVLPKTTLLEEEGVFVEYGAPCLSVFNRAVNPRGEVRSDMEIAIALYEALRVRGGLDYELIPWKTPREFIDFQLQDTGLEFDALNVGYHAYSYEYGTYRTTGFNTPSKRIELWSRHLDEAGYDPLPDYKAPDYAAADKDFQFVLMTGIRTMSLHHSRFRNHAWARRGQKAPELRINTELAKSMEIANNDWVWVETRNGAARVYMQAKLGDDVAYNVVATGMGWWFPELRGYDHGALNFNVEAAIPYGPVFDPISGSPESRNCACRIGKVSEAELASGQFAEIGQKSEEIA